MMNSLKTQTLYAIRDYNQPLEKGILKVDVNKAINLLEAKQDEFSYHIRLINNETIYPLYCDIDGTKEQRAKPLDEIVSYFNDYFKSKIIITQSETTKKNSYHIIIPEYEATIETQKQYWKIWNDEHIEYTVDLNVYKTTMFRLPNQLKPYAGEYKGSLIPETRHHIINGEMKDFLFERYDGAQLLCPPQSISEPKKHTSECVDSTDTAKYINCLSEQRATDYKTWLEVGMCLRNIETTEDANINYWIAFSKKATFPDSDIQLATKYAKIKPKSQEEKAFRVGSLKMWAKQDNPELYKQYFPIKCLIDDSDPDYLFTEWEKTHCKILNPPSYLEHKIDTQTFEEIYIIRNTTHLEQAFNHLTIDVRVLKKNGDETTKKQSFIKSWINLNDKIKIFDRLGVYPYPLTCPSNQYNCWSKFRGDLLPEIKQEYPNELARFKELISILCNHEEPASNYLEKWIAQAIQYPANKTTVPTLISKQGAGKGTLIKLITALLGEKKVLSTTKAEVVFGRFNNQMLDAYLVNLDELSPKDVKDCEGKIKGLITEPTISIDVKGVSSLTVKSYHRFINTTNNNFGVFKTEIGDRRNFIVRCSDELIGNKEYFKNFNDEIIQNNEVVKYIYNYLKSIPDLDKFHLAGSIPKTSYGEELKQASRTDYDLWLEDFTNRHRNSELNNFTTKQLLDDLCSFSKKDFNSKSFGIQLLNIVPNAITKGKHTRQGETKDFNWKLLREHYKEKLCLIDDEEDNYSNATTPVYINSILQAD